MFKFKEFSVSQEKAAMKIGTDGVLLGAWTPLENHPNSILDIGAGTGLIALMLAQRSNAELIDAIELESEAYEECVENFEVSPWADRLFCYHADLRELIEEPEDHYDLIVSNPPFYTTDVLESNKRTTARQTESLPFELLLYAVRTLLSPDGVFSCIIPYQEEVSFLNLAEKCELDAFKITRVRGRDGSPIKRSLIALCFGKQKTKEDELIIEIERNHYTKDYIELTKSFYLKM